MVKQWETYIELVSLRKSKKKGRKSDLVHNFIAQQMCKKESFLFPKFKADLTQVVLFLLEKRMKITLTSASSVLIELPDKSKCVSEAMIPALDRKAWHSPFTPFDVKPVREQAISYRTISITW